jgi:hypothetical protein
MKTNILSGIVCAALFAGNLAAQSYSVDWYKIGGGGGTSSGGRFQVTGTIGQPDAGAMASGGSFSVTGGFWSAISVLSTAGLPNLYITQLGNSVFVWWPATDYCTLQQSSNLTGGAWTSCGYGITTNNGVCGMCITPASGSMFFRLKRP